MRGGRLAGELVCRLAPIARGTTWGEARAGWQRGQANPLAPLQDIEGQLPFALLGLASDNGGEFLNWHLRPWCQQRAGPVQFTRRRPCKQDDHAPIEQQHWTHLRPWFGDERPDHPAVGPRPHALPSGVEAHKQGTGRPPEQTPR